MLKIIYLLQRHMMFTGFEDERLIEDDIKCHVLKVSITSNSVTWITF